MEVGSQTEPMDPQDILNLLRQKSLEMERKSGVSAGEQDEIHSVEFIDGEVYFNSHNEPEFRKNSHSTGKSTSSIKSKSHPLGQPSLADKICDAVWSRKESLHGSSGPSRTASSKSNKMPTRSHSFKGSSSSNLSPTKTHPVAVPGISMDPYARRGSGSGCSSYIIRSCGNKPPRFDSREHLPTYSPKFDSSRIRRSQGDIDIKRQISATLSIPSREDSVKSTSSKISSGHVSPVVNFPTFSTTANAAKFPTSFMNNNNNSPTGQQLQQFYRLSQDHGSSSKSLVPSPSPQSMSVRQSRSSSITQSVMGCHQPQDGVDFDADSREKKQRKYVILGFTILLFIAITVVVTSLSISSYIDAKVRKQNDAIMNAINQHTSTANITINNSSSIPPSEVSPQPPPIEVEDGDEDENMGNYNRNNNADKGQSLTRTIITVDPQPVEIQPQTQKDWFENRMNKTLNTTTPKEDSVERENGSGGRPFTSTRIGEIIVRNIKGVKYENNMTKITTTYSPTTMNIKLETVNSSSSQEISDDDIDENDRVQTKILLQ